MKNLFREIFGRIWALWGLILFVPSLCIFVWPIVISYLLPDKWGMKVFRVTTQVWMWLFLRLIGCPLRIVGRENYKPGENFVVVSNHSSLMDVPLLTPFFPGANKTIAKRSMARIPVFGWVYTRGSVLVDRSSDASRRKSYEDMKKVLLEEGINMAIYPEGTRNRTGKPLKEFYDGAFRLAIDCHRRIIPVVMFHTATVLPPGKPFFLWPHPLEMHLLPPVSPDGMSIADLKQRVFDQMWQYITERGGANA